MGLTMYALLGSLSVDIYPGALFKSAGMRCTKVAQVSSTVAGRLTTMVVSGSPKNVHSFLSHSSGA